MKNVSAHSRSAKKTTISPKGKQRAVWNAQLEKSLVEILHEYKDSGCRSDNGWNSEGWNRIVKEFHIRNKYVTFTRKQVQEKDGELRRDYKMLKAARQQSGSSWNNKICMVEGPAAMWENLQISFPKIKKFRNNKATVPLFDALGEVYDGHLAEGKFNCTSNESMEDEEPPLGLLQELDEDSEHEDDVMLLEGQRREEEADVADAVYEEQRTSREEETSQGSRGMTEEQIRLAAIAKRREQKQRNEEKKSNRLSRIENVMERLLEVRTKEAEEDDARTKKQDEEETARLAKQAAESNDFSISRCIVVVNTLDLTKQEKAKAMSVFIKSKENREAFIKGCEVDAESTVIWLRNEMV